MAFGPDAGLRLVDEIEDAAALRDYAPLPAAKGDLLFRARRLAEAWSESAATLTRNARERTFSRTGGRLRRQAVNPRRRVRDVYSRANRESASPK
jgi:predicted RNA polymerase sigma factor